MTEKQIATLRRLKECLTEAQKLNRELMLPATLSGVMDLGSSLSTVLACVQQLQRQQRDKL